MPVKLISGPAVRKRAFTGFARQVCEPVLYSPNYLFAGFFFRLFGRLVGFRQTRYETASTSGGAFAGAGSP
jgi:hypothetical protein